MTIRRATQELVTLIEDEFLKNGAGDLNPQIDDITVAWRKLTGVSLDAAKYFVNARLDRAIEVLDKDHGWSCWARVTSDFYHLTREPDDTDWPLLVRCVAGQGRGSAAVGIHFHAKTDQNCWLWHVWRDFSDRVAEGVREEDDGNLFRVRKAALQPTVHTDALLGKRIAERKRESDQLRLS